MTKPLDLTGEVFGRLTALQRATNTANGNARWSCRCVCGGSSEVSATSLARGITKSCGCLMREVRKSGDTTRRHGMRHTKEYEAWKHIRRRCYSPAERNFSDYGGRGIKVCARWNESFESFYADLGPAPGPHYSIDRIDNNGDYEPGNCRWATTTEQNRNKRTNRQVSFRGHTQPLVTWCEELGLRYNIVASRLDRGWPADRAFTTISPRLRK